MVTPLVVGLDLGTSAVKAAVLDGDGREVAVGRAPMPWRTVPTGAEIDPDALVAAAMAAAAEALDAAPQRDRAGSGVAGRDMAGRGLAGGSVAGIGVAGMAETGVLVDAAGRPVVPAIAWHDSRGEAEAARMASDFGAEAFAARVGLPCSSLCTLAKYRWLRDHRPEAARGVRWFNVAEWIVRGLGGEPAAELSLASRTGFYDLHARRPWDDALAWADAPAGLMPEAVPAGTPMGAAGDALPAARGAVLTVGGHDHLAAAVGAGAAGEGDVLDSCGTAEAFVRASAPLPPERVAQAVASGITVGWHAVEGRQALLGALWSGAELERVLERLGVPTTQRDELEAAALAIERDEHGAASRAVEPDEHVPTARTVGHEANSGLAPTVGRDERSEVAPDERAARAYHAALHIQAAAAAEVLAHMSAVAGPARRLVVTGGWAAGEGARAVKERHLGPFEHSPALSTGARGAALIAGQAAGLWTVDETPLEVA